MRFYMRHNYPWHIFQQLAVLGTNLTTQLYFFIKYLQLSQKDSCLQRIKTAFKPIRT